MMLNAELMLPTATLRPNRTGYCQTVIQSSRAHCTQLTQHPEVGSARLDYPRERSQARPIPARCPLLPSSRAAARHLLASEGQGLKRFRIELRQCLCCTRNQSFELGLWLNLRHRRVFSRAATCLHHLIVSNPPASMASITLSATFPLGTP